MVSNVWGYKLDEEKSTDEVKPTKEVKIMYDNLVDEGGFRLVGFFFFSKLSYNEDLFKLDKFEITEGDMDRDVSINKSYLIKMLNDAVKEKLEGIFEEFNNQKYIYILGFKEEKKTLETTIETEYKIYNVTFDV